MAVEIADLTVVAGQVLDEVERAIVGKRSLLQQIMAGVLAGGHILLEDFPGLAKTLIANCFSVALGLSFKRIQFTPDLLPGDVTGGYVFDRAQSRFEMRKGPIFANTILADEINRASPKTQSALLEAMQEYQVTIEGETIKLPQPFIVIATQNPIEYEGTFPLPEAQLDRFLMKLGVGYPSPEEEQEILRRRQQRKRDEFDMEQVTDAQTLLAMREAVEGVYVDPDIERYIVDIVGQTRQDRRVAVGASPRGSLGLLKLARAHAALAGRDYVLPDDVKHFAGPVLVHRLILKPDFWMVERAAADVVEAVVGAVPVPVIDGA
jgi:MoxR-like ATPase